MYATFIHLAVSHVPVLFIPLAVVLLIVGIKKSLSPLNKAALIILIVSALSSIAVFQSGEGAEESVEHKPEVTEATIHEHEEAAEFAFPLTLICGALAIGALVISCKKKDWEKMSLTAVAVAATLTSAALLRTAYLGGHIRHVELSQRNPDLLKPFDPDFLEEIETPKESETEKDD
jgi:uncharacterized membrane protein